MASVPKNKGKSKVAVAAPTAARFETIREQFRTASEHCDDSKQLQKTKAWVALLELTVQTLRTYLLTGSPTDADARQIHGFGKAVDEALRLWRLPADESQQPHAALPRSGKPAAIDQELWGALCDGLAGVQASLGQIHMVNYLTFASPMESMQEVLQSLVRIKRMNKDLKPPAEPARKRSSGEAPGEVPGEAPREDSKRRKKGQSRRFLEPFLQDAGLPKVLRFWLSKFHKKKEPLNDDAAEVTELLDRLKKTRVVLLDKLKRQGHDDEAAADLERRCFLEETNDDDHDKPIACRLQQLLKIYELHASSVAVKRELATASVTL